MKETFEKIRKPALLNYPDRPKDALSVVRWIKDIDQRFLAPESMQQFIDANMDKGTFLKKLEWMFTKEELEKHELWFVLNEKEPPKDGSIEFFDLPGEYSIESFYRWLERKQRKIKEIELDREFQKMERKDFMRRLLDHFGEDALNKHSLWYKLRGSRPPKDDIEITDADLPGDYSIEEFLKSQEDWWQKIYPKNNNLEI